MDNTTLPFEIFNNISDGLAIYDTSGKMIYNNRQFKLLMSLEKDRNTPCPELIDLVDNFQNSENFSASESVCLSSSGKKFIVFLHYIKDTNQKIYTLVLIKEDRKIKDHSIALAEHMFDEYLNKKQLHTVPLDKKLQGLIGDDSQFRSTLLGAQKAAVSDFPIMIRGDSGTGKEILARAIHSMSPYSSGPFVDINCSAIPDSLIESELFGYDKGAFTSAHRGGKAGLFEEAHQGSIFLDEIGDISLSAQAKILRVLEEKTFRRVGSTKNRTVDVRVISATNRDLEEMITEREFREDLYYRLNTFSIMLPPLRERGRDIQLLANHFLQNASKECSKGLNFSSQTIQVLEQYPWPGNVRELRGVVEYAMVMCDEKEITPSNLPSFILHHQPSETDTEQQALYRNLTESKTELPLLPTILKEVEKNVMRAAINKAKNKSEAIKSLGISRRAFYYKLKEYDLEMDLE